MIPRNSMIGERSRRSPGGEEGGGLREWRQRWRWEAHAERAMIHMKKHPLSTLTRSKEAAAAAATTAAAAAAAGSAVAAGATG